MNCDCLYSFKPVMSKLLIKFFSGISRRVRYVSKLLPWIEVRGGSRLHVPPSAFQVRIKLLYAIKVIGCPWACLSVRLFVPKNIITERKNELF